MAASARAGNRFELGGIPEADARLGSRPLRHPERARGGRGIGFHQRRREAGQRVHENDPDVESGSVPRYTAVLLARLRAPASEEERSGLDLVGLYGPPHRQVEASFHPPDLLE